MKRAKVSSVYEGRGNLGNNEGEEVSEISSKSARITAKARTSALRAKRAQSIVSKCRTIVTRSMALKKMELKEDEKLIEVDMFECNVLEKRDDIKPVEPVQQQEQEQEQEQEQPLEPVQQQEQEQEPEQPLLLEPVQQQEQEEQPQQQQQKQDQEEQPPVSEVVVENKSDDWDWLEDWPMTPLTFEDDRRGVGLHFYWENMDGELLARMMDDELEPFWHDDHLWNFNLDNDDITKP
ncbi:hypothetical protein PTKIN_Ptkin12aG0055200 [Pterospermum kingtungense]